MDFLKTLEENALLLVSQDMKEPILHYIHEEHLLVNIKFISFQELKKGLLFDYTNETIYEVMKYYHASYGVAKNWIENLYYMKDYYDKNGNCELKCIDIDRLCSNFCEYKKYIYTTKPTFIHKDINLNNVLTKDNNIYFIDTDGGKFSFSVLDFRGICWWTWDGENKGKEQAMYRGIFKGLLGNNIPYTFHKELAFTIIYEFLLKIEEVNKTKDLKRMEYIFSKFGDIFNKTNYFEDYRFDWLN